MEYQYIQPPDNFEMAKKNELWVKAIRCELEAMDKFQVWAIVDRPSDRSVVTNKWVFSIKKDSEGKVKYKARLVAKGYSQEKGIDYHETYSPVVKIDSLKVLPTLATKNGMMIRQVDVNTGKKSNSPSL